MSAAAISCRDDACAMTPFWEPTPPPAAPVTEPSTNAGLRLIVAYKLVKAALEMLLGALLLSSLARKIVAVTGAANIRHHATEAWSLTFAERLLHSPTTHSLHVIALAAILDGAVSLVEGWALHRRYSWSGWLVVATTSCLLPFEFIALVRHPTAGHLVLLVLNALIVIYLIWRRDTMMPNPA